MVSQIIEKKISNLIERQHMRKAAYIGVVSLQEDGSFKLLVGLGPFGFTFPGGGVEKYIDEEHPGETPREAAARELEEETNLIVEQADLHFISRGFYNDPVHGEQEVIFFSIDSNAVDGTIESKNNEIKRFEWIDINEARQLVEEGLMSYLVLIGFQQIEKDLSSEPDTSRRV